jgi:hypothetical protein
LDFFVSFLKNIQNIGILVENFAPIKSLFLNLNKLVFGGHFFFEPLSINNKPLKTNVTSYFFKTKRRSSKVLLP